MPFKKSEYLYMSFYGFIEKAEFQSLIREAKKSCMKDALLRLKNFDPMNELFYRSAMPDDTPKALIQKRLNPLRLKKEEKELKRLLG